MLIDSHSSVYRDTYDESHCRRFQPGCAGQRRQDCRGRSGRSGACGAPKRSGGVWFGWSGDVVANPDETVRITESGRLARATVDLSERDYEEYYNRFANSTLWPLFHYRVDLVQLRPRQLHRLSARQQGVRPQAGRPAAAR